MIAIVVVRTAVVMVVMEPSAIVIATVYVRTKLVVRLMLALVLANTAPTKRVQLKPIFPAFLNCYVIYCFYIFVNAAQDREIKTQAVA